MSYIAHFITQKNKKINERLVKKKKKFRVECALPGPFYKISEISFGACFKTNTWEALSGI